ncbi:MAG: hypothetical protein CMQ05_10950 [Gammaproteobacteria bacterium]|nr:hypothetical protein [Gammaproteobacteria bacterium]RPG24296.1 MAG: hypothetical protein CBC10_011925 [Gammaproteobacteria bacterium TMED50]|tara:strand:- start:1700 stop:2173 length:474 start_codon:yes stop_codon:yes gene_type:complete
MQPRSGRPGAILKSLNHRYPTDEVAQQPLDKEALLTYIETVETESLGGAESSLLSVIEKLDVDPLAQDDRGVLAYLDESLALIDHHTDFDPQALALLNTTIPFLARSLLIDPTLPNPESQRPFRSLTQPRAGSSDGPPTLVVQRAERLTNSSQQPKN